MSGNAIQTIIVWLAIMNITYLCSILEAHMDSRATEQANSLRKSTIFRMIIINGHLPHCLGEIDKQSKNIMLCLLLGVMNAQLGKQW